MKEHLIPVKNTFDYLQCSYVEGEGFTIKNAEGELIYVIPETYSKREMAEDLEALFITFRNAGYKQGIGAVRDILEIK